MVLGKFKLCHKTPSSRCGGGDRKGERGEREEGREGKLGEEVRFTPMERLSGFFIYKCEVSRWASGPDNMDFNFSNVSPRNVKFGY